MNTTITERRHNAARIKIELTREDYQAEVKKELNKLAREMVLPGFRKGNVPKSMIQQRYGTQIQTEVIAEIAAKELDRIIEAEKLHIYAHPLPEYDSMDALAEEAPVLEFSVPLIPEEMDFDFSGKSFKEYQVEIPDSLLNKELTRLQEAHSTTINTEEIKKESILQGDFTEMEGDQPKEGGIQQEGAVILMKAIQDEEQQAKLLECHKGDVINLELYKALGENMNLFQSALRHTPEEELEAHKESIFQFRIETIQEQKKAGLGKEFYNKVFEEDKVHNKEEALAEIRRVQEANYKSQAEYIFITNVMSYLKEEKMPKLDLDADLLYRNYVNRFLERYQREEHKGDTPKLASKEEVLKYAQEQTYMDALQEKQEIEVSEAEAKDFAKQVIRQEILGMGLQDLGDDFLEHMLQYRIEQESNYLYLLSLNLRDQKVILSLRDQLTLEPTTVSREEFEDLLTLAQETNTSAPKEEEEEEVEAEETEAVEPTEETAAEEQ